MGIQQGVVDGQENPLPTIDANAFYEVCDNLLMTDHVIAAVTYTLSLIHIYNRCHPGSD